MTGRRIGIVVQRFGPDLVGGAEGHARAIARTLARRDDVTVLTTCARDAGTWAMEYEPGVSVDEGLRVLRFAHPQRNAGGRARVPLRHKLRMKARAAFDLLGVDRVARPTGNGATDGHEFLRRQGPFCDGLVEALGDGTLGLDAVVFMTALFYPTAAGLPAWGRRSVLVPTLHDEKPMYLPCYGAVLGAAGEVLYNTHAERSLAVRLYGRRAPEGRVVGVGVPLRSVAPDVVEDVRRRHGLPSRYVVYVGRIEAGKGCRDVLSAWRALQPDGGDAALVFVGRGPLSLDGVSGVIALGYLPEQERDAVVAGAAAAVVPSRLESLSLVLLEALALGVPVVANADCAVLADHVAASGAGTGYRGIPALAKALRHALQRPAADRAALGAAGRAYVAAHYPPALIEQAWLDAVDRACDR